MSGLLVARRGSLNPRRAADYAAEVLADSPIAYWRFEETSGSTVADEVGSATGTVYGANLDVAGQVGSGASFDGTDDYIDVGTLGTFGTDMQTASSWEFFAKWTGTAHYVAMGTVNDDIATVAQIQLNVDVDESSSAGRIRAYLRHEGGSASFRATSGSTYNDGNWHHVVVTWAGSTSYPDIYVDGSLDNGLKGGDGGTESSADFQYPLTLGARNTRGTISNFLPGQMDEPALYDKVLTSARILAHAQAAGVA